MSYTKKIAILIIASTLLRLLLAGSLELSADEVYYWTYALKLQWNYFDHPPMVAWLIRLTTGNLLLHNEIFVRLGAIIASAVCTWLIFKTGTLINNLQTGWYTALFYTASLYASVNAGAFIIPDSPLMIFWLAGIFLLIKILRLNAAATTHSTLLWCLFGITSGLCIMSKVHGVFIWLGVILYVLFINREWLKQKGIYLSAFITLIIISPIIIWNFQHNFITYTFHSSRVNPTGGGLHLFAFYKALLQQVSINNPVSFFLICSGTWLAFKGKLTDKKAEVQLLLLCSLPLILVITSVALFRETFPHWSAPAYTCLLLLPAIKMASATKNNTRSVPLIIKFALAYTCIVFVSEILVINHLPGTLSTNKRGMQMGLNDLTLDMYGWKTAGVKFDSLYKSDIAQQIMPADAPVLVTNWYPAAHIEYYITNLTKQQVIGIGNLTDLHQYYLTNNYKRPLKMGDNAYMIVPSHSFYYRTFNEVSEKFSSFDIPLVIPQFRGGVLCQNIYVFRFKGYH